MNPKLFVRPTPVSASTSTLGGASSADEKSNISSLLDKISTNIRTVESHREQIAAVTQFINQSSDRQEVESGTSELAQLSNQTQYVIPPALESARRSAQQLVTYLTVASHMPSGVDVKLRSMGDSLLNGIDDLQSRGVDSTGLVRVRSLLEQFPAVVDWTDLGVKPKFYGALNFPATQQEPSISETLGLTPQIICRNLPPDVQQWFVSQGSDCTTLPPDVLVGVARCGLMNKLYDMSSGKCSTIAGVVDAGPELPIDPKTGLHKEPAPGAAPEPSSDVSPWLVGGLVLAATAAGFWFLRRSSSKSSKSSSKTPKKANVK